MYKVRGRGQFAGSGGVERRWPIDDERGKMDFVSNRRPTTYSPTMLAPASKLFSKSSLTAFSKLRMT